MILLDTNYLLRFLTNDIKTQAADAKKLIKYSIEINVPVVAIAETVYFLRNYYKKIIIYFLNFEMFDVMGQ